jgi:hypothetical protein
VERLTAASQPGTQASQNFNGTSTRDPGARQVLVTQSR